MPETLPSFVTGIVLGSLLTFFPPPGFSDQENFLYYDQHRLVVFTKFSSKTTNHQIPVFHKFVFQTSLVTDELFRELSDKLYDQVANHFNLVDGGFLKKLMPKFVEIFQPIGLNSGIIQNDEPIRFEVHSFRGLFLKPSSTKIYGRSDTISINHLVAPCFISDQDFIYPEFAYIHKVYYLFTKIVPSLGLRFSQQNFFKFLSGMTHLVATKIHLHIVPRLNPIKYGQIRDFTIAPWKIQNLTLSIFPPWFSTLIRF